MCTEHNTLELTEQSWSCFWHTIKNDWAKPGQECSIGLGKTPYALLVERQNSRDAALRFTLVRNKREVSPIVEKQTIRSFTVKLDLWTVDFIHHPNETYWRLRYGGFYGFLLLSKFSESADDIQHTPHGNFQKFFEFLSKLDLWLTKIAVHPERDQFFLSWLRIFNHPNGVSQNLTDDLKMMVRVEMKRI